MGNLLRKLFHDITRTRLPTTLLLLTLCAHGLVACASQTSSASAGIAAASAPQAAPAATLVPTNPPSVTFEPRPLYAPGELVDYIAQSGDTLPNLAVRFNTTVEKILQANPFIPANATTMPPGMPMKIPIYYLPLWGMPYRILPDSQFINGPAQVGFDTAQFVDQHPGWLKDYQDYVSDDNRSGAGIVDLVAQNYSISPRLLLALLEYQAKALSEPQPDPDTLEYPLGNRSWDHKGLFLQLAWAANQLNNSYYRFRTSALTSIEHRNGRIERFDPWLNGASASLHHYFNGLLDYDAYMLAISPDGLASVYQRLFGDPWQAEQAHIPGSLTQPELALPFQPGYLWALTGGPHTGWGTGEPLAALDFAPPSTSGGCVPSKMWVTAMAPGVVVRSETGVVVLDLDDDGDERTGWVIFYLHLATEGRAVKGATLNTGDPVGHPSCEGGTSTGTHVHVARKYNGEWMLAGGMLAFNLEGWIAHNGEQVYLGTLTRDAQVVTACTCSNFRTFIQTGRKPTGLSEGQITPSP